MSTYMGATDKKGKQIDFCYETVEDTFMAELIDAEFIDDIKDELYIEITRVIEHYNLDLEVENVLPLFAKTWNLKDAV